MPNYKKNDIVSCNVIGLETYGIFVNLDEYYSGLIHISEISNEFIENINDFVKIGDTIYARILEVDDETFKVKLSIKNIDYKVDGKRIRKPLKEVGLGFKPLKDKLSVWIDEKIAEIDEKHS